METAAPHTDTHRCPICIEVMLHPALTPSMMVPCGHTFCKRCLDRLSPKGMTCPLCCAAATATVPNHSLRSIVEAAHANSVAGPSLTHEMEERIQKANVDEGKVEMIRQYVAMHSLAEARMSVLGAEKAAAQDEWEQTERSAAVDTKVLDYLRTEESSLLQNIQKLAGELDMVRQQMSEKTAGLSSTEQQQQAVSGKLSELNASLAAISQESLKARTFLSHLAPELEL